MYLSPHIHSISQWNQRSGPKVIQIDRDYILYVQYNIWDRIQLYNRLLLYRHNALHSNDDNMRIGSDTISRVAYRGFRIIINKNNRAAVGHGAVLRFLCVIMIRPRRPPGGRARARTRRRGERRRPPRNNARSQQTLTPTVSNGRVVNVFLAGIQTGQVNYNE